MLFLFSKPTSNHYRVILLIVNLFKHVNVIIVTKKQNFLVHRFVKSCHSIQNLKWQSFGLDISSSFARQPSVKKVSFEMENETSRQWLSILIRQPFCWFDSFTIDEESHSTTICHYTLPMFLSFRFLRLMLIMYSSFIYYNIMPIKF